MRAAKRVEMSVKTAELVLKRGEEIKKLMEGYPRPVKITALLRIADSMLGEGNRTMIRSSNGSGK